jgi:hypothetical protein
MGVVFLGNFPASLACFLEAAALQSRLELIPRTAAVAVINHGCNSRILSCNTPTPTSQKPGGRRNGRAPCGVRYTTAWSCTILHG